VLAALASGLAPALLEVDADQGPADDDGQQCEPMPTQAASIATSRGG